MCRCCVGGVDTGSERLGGAPVLGGFSTLTLHSCSQRCCHCCLLGRAAQAAGQSCEYTLMVGYQCGLVFRACCVKGQETADFAPGDIGDIQEAGNSPTPFLPSGQGISQC